MDIELRETKVEKEEQEEGLSWWEQWGRVEKTDYVSAYA